MAKGMSMKYFSVSDRRRVLLVAAVVTLCTLGLAARLTYLMIFRSQYYTDRATALHERERSIKAPRGTIYDVNGQVLAGNKPVSTISVIHNQITDAEAVIDTLADMLELDREQVAEKVNKVSSREKIKSNVDKETADAIRALELDGVMVDEDYKRYYPYDTLASKVIGFTGADNQGIVGLEVYYDDYLMGETGSINTLTDARGIELENAAERRVEPEAGYNLVTTIDVNIQLYAQQLAERVLEEKNAKRVCILVMNPQNGEILSLVDIPEYNLNDPYSLPENTSYTEDEMQDALNQMWRCFCINDTYEPGSTFKMVTATMAFEAGVLSVEDTFNCPGYKIVEDRKIRCSKVTGHGAQTFRQGIMNSCNPVFMEVGARVGVEGFYYYFDRLGLNEKTGIDLPGEASSILHKQENVGPVELATMSFGQSFQITPMELARAASAIVNGGTLVTPHFGKYITDENDNIVQVLEYETVEQTISQETSATMRDLLFSVVDEGTGKNAKVEGYAIGGKTATSEKLPRKSGKYISSFLGFAPAENPQVLALLLIDEPEGVYYGGTIAAPVVGELFSDILPYLGFEKEETSEENTTNES
jgi:stage V sporulation protein D (sporulation-specific penicillin-binding protein)